METKNKEIKKAVEKEIIDKINSGEITLFVNIEVNDKRSVICYITSACENGDIQLNTKQKLKDLNKMADR